MSESGPLDPFHAALIAFEIRFERELTSRWEKLEYEVADAIISNPSGSKKHFLLDRFLADAGNQVSGAVHLYFPRLLNVATTGRQNLGSQSPLAWTKAQVWTQVCNFLDMDEKFDHASVPRDGSRVLLSALRISNNSGWDGTESPASPVASQLPAWVDTHWLNREMIDRAFNVEPSLIDAEPMSLAETLKWAKYEEFLMYRRLEQQIEDEEFDGIIEAGRNGISVLEPFHGDGSSAKYNQGDGEAAQVPQGNKFVREATTWAITFDGEACRIKPMLGLDYISVLLQNACVPLKALRLQALAGGLLMSPDQTSEPRSSLVNGDSNQSLQEDNQVASRGNFGESEVVDDVARRQCRERLEKIETEISYWEDAHDKQRVDTLRTEASDILDYLNKSCTVHGRPRTFPGENEKARQSITKALERAYTTIRAHAPKTADYLQSQITKGSTFIYRDASTRWHIQRNPSSPAPFLS